MKTFSAILLLSPFVLAAGAVRAADDVDDVDLKRFQQLCQLSWQRAFHDPCTGDWHAGWMLDGRKARIANGPAAMDFFAGPVRREDASHAVLWTKESFHGALRIDYRYTKLDAAAARRGSS